MRRNIVHSKGLKLFAGIDLHSTSFTSYFIDENERKVAGGQFPATEETIREKFKPFIGQNLHVAVEIGNSTFWFCDILENMNFKYTIVNTLDYARTSNNKNKDDKRDARNLSFDLKRNNLPTIPVVKPGLVQRELRSLLVQRSQYVKDSTRCINRTCSFLDYRGIKVKKGTLKNSLKNWEALFNRLNQDQSCSEFVKATLRRYHEDYKYLQAQLKNVEDLIKSLIKRHYFTNYLRLLTVPGMGFVTAACMIAQVGDWNRFKSGKQLAAYFGLAPSIRNSNNKKLKGDGHITKEGSSLMRGYLIQAGNSVMNCKGLEALPLKQWYQNIKNRKGWKKARVALVRKMCEIAFAMIRNGANYDPLLLEKNNKPAL